MTEALGHLLVQRCLEDIPVNSFNNPPGAGQLQAPLPGLGHHRRRCDMLRRQLPDSSTGVLPSTHDSPVITHDAHPTRLKSGESRPETPFVTQSPLPGSSGMRD
ncbi:hypothetical protein [Actinoplanes sp. NPDC049599]|uniref:hypothetical protein n=1 Tax=Actinoplanes sp. NPDC049599 TaxID=3363903 RepID=UPI0037BC39EE